MILWIANPLCDDTACWHAALRVLRAEAAKIPCNHPIGNIYLVYIANWVIIYHLSPIIYIGTRNNYSTCHCFDAPFAKVGETLLTFLRPSGFISSHSSCFNAAATFSKRFGELQCSILEMTVEFNGGFWRFLALRVGKSRIFNPEIYTSK